MENMEDIFQKIGTTQTLSQKIERNIEKAIRKRNCQLEPNYLPSANCVKCLPLAAPHCAKP